MSDIRIRTYNKLIRDKIPEILDAKGINYSIRELSQSEYKAKLNGKLHEELQEYVTASPEERLAELADMVEVIHAIIVNSGATIEQFERIRKQKLEERGGFQQKLLLISTSE
ncbi:nucleoside triphosphate pyrophosphohydrolase [Paenibacillus thalictri]|uniref:Phosphoribosyl-ATP pyrophosphohydrolase n=1 Tax=Paenibacillus thalictri TaxID=2527873 RepID=A0A4Q9DRY6_9BACL|nr:nucleoside triphosphate pyrophosphohydrolase [Paenibacillus thalictri]TBL77655.1 phosphoribosyl-ATP pyrophosphohydrolase [Paenibacillus thalictri]